MTEPLNDMLARQGKTWLAQKTAKRAPVVEPKTKRAMADAARDAHRLTEQADRRSVVQS